MKKTVKPVPEGFHALTPTLTVKDARKALEFYKKAFGAVAAPGVCLMPDEKVGHAELTIGDSKLMINDEFPEMKCLAPQGEARSSALYLYVKDADSVFRNAVSAGAKTLMPLADQFWGDRVAQVQDPFGHRWTIATHKEDLTEEQIKERMKEAFAVPAGK